MTRSLDPTHDPALRSWVDEANAPGTDFPIQNLPYGVFRPRGGGGARVGVAIGDRILDVLVCLDAGLLSGEAAEAAESLRPGVLNGLMALGRGPQRSLRQALSGLLREGESRLAGDGSLVERALLEQGGVEMLLPARVGDYTDFYASVHHATNVGSMFRPDHPLLPNYKYIPVGYHGRASSVVVSGTPVRRPLGQTRPDEDQPPVFGPTRLLDYELELGVFVGRPNAMGEPVGIDEAEEHLFGVCLVNDWSARDMQKWEYQPLGPFLAKSFATSIGPWVVTLDALAPYRTAAFPRPDGDPAPLPHLWGQEDQRAGGLDLWLEVALRTAKMAEQGLPAARLSRGNFDQMYWTLAQMFTHHASNGCPLRPGDLLASGTVSGPEKESRGCLLELTWRGSEPVVLPGGEERRFLQDGDELILRGFCEAEGRPRIGLGECRGVVVGAGERA